MSPGPLRKAGRFLTPLLLGPVVIVLDRLDSCRRADAVRARRRSAHSVLVADRRGDGQPRAAHRSGDRRLPERDVRQRAGAHHRDRRHLRRLDRGRAGIAGGLDRRQPPARPRLHASLRPEAAPSIGCLPTPRSASSGSPPSSSSSPSIPGFHGDPDRRSLAVLSLPFAVVLLIVRVTVTRLALRRQRQLYSSAAARRGRLATCPLPSACSGSRRS